MSITHDPPNRAIRHYNLGLVFFEKYLLTESIAEFTAAVREAQDAGINYPSALYNRGIVHALISAYEDARSDLHAVRELQPDQPDVLYALGEVELLAGNSREAREYFEITLRLTERGSAIWHKAGVGLGLLTQKADFGEQADEDHDASHNGTGLFTNEQLGRLRFWKARFEAGLEP